MAPKPKDTFLPVGAAQEKPDTTKAEQKAIEDDDEEALTLIFQMMDVS